MGDHHHNFLEYTILKALREFQRERAEPSHDVAAVIVLVESILQRMPQPVSESWNHLGLLSRIAEAVNNTQRAADAARASAAKADTCYRNILTALEEMKKEKLL